LLLPAQVVDRSQLLSGRKRELDNFDFIAAGGQIVLRIIKRN
jgi:hypothetical protein